MGIGQLMVTCKVEVNKVQFDQKVKKHVFGSAQCRLQDSKLISFTVITGIGQIMVEWKMDV